MPTSHHEATRTISMLLHSSTTDTAVPWSWAPLPWEHRVSRAFSLQQQTRDMTNPFTSPEFYLPPTQTCSACSVPLRRGFGCHLPPPPHGIPNWAAGIPAVLPNCFTAAAATGKETPWCVLPLLQTGQDAGLECFCTALNLIKETRQNPAAVRATSQERFAYKNQPVQWGLFVLNITQLTRLPLKYYDHWGCHYINKYSETLSDWYVLEWLLMLLELSKSC